MPKQISYRFFLLPAGSQDPGEWKPAMDIYQTRQGWLLKCDLAGVRPEDVLVRIQGCQVTVEGVRRDAVVFENIARRYSMEIAYNRFARTVELPCEFPDPHTDVSIRDGFLYIQIRDDQPGRSDDRDQQQ